MTPQDLKLGHSIGVQVVKATDRKKRGENLPLKGKFHIEHFGKEKDGKRDLLKAFDVDNGITNDGKNDVLSSLFQDAASKRTGWAIGQIDGTGFTALDDVNDVMSSHIGWVEFTAYSEPTRPVWNPGAAAAQAITNATPRDFNITGTGTLQGVFISSDDTISGTTGILWATALYTSPLAVGIGDLIKITYTVTA